MKAEVFGQKGITLIELMIAMAIAGIVTAAIYTVYISQVRTTITQEVVLELQQGLRGSLSLMAGEIRTAGTDPQDSAGAGIEIANADQFHFTRDIVGDAETGQYNGEIDEDIEDIRYFVNDNNALQRETGSSGQPMTILENIDALNFVYLETIEAGGGSLNNDGQANVDPEKFDSIRYVQITIVASSGQSDRGLLRVYRDNNSYVNQRDVNIFDANDTSRRMRMTTTIALRNIKGD